jgi:hypothetical protein
LRPIKGGIVIRFQGVEVNATSDFGGFDAMAYLDPSQKIIEPYMANLVKFFTGVSNHFFLIFIPV